MKVYAISDKNGVTSAYMTLTSATKELEAEVKSCVNRGWKVHGRVTADNFIRVELESPHAMDNKIVMQCVEVQ